MTNIECEQGHRFLAPRYPYEAAELPCWWTSGTQRCGAARFVAWSSPHDKERLEAKGLLHVDQGGPVERGRAQGISA